MTAGDIALLALGVLAAAFTAWALWPRPKWRPGPRNNWRQRSGDEVESGKTPPAGLEGVPYSIGPEGSGD
jgi:hypothetical protein